MGNIIKKVSIIVITIMCLNLFIKCGVINGLNSAANMLKQSDLYAKRKCLKLSSPAGSCSGVQIKAPSGKQFILSAGHCGVLAMPDKSIMVETEDHTFYFRKIIAIDISKDLLLLEGVPDLEGLTIAQELSENTHIRTFTHGKGFSTYKTEGYMVQEISLPIEENLILQEMAITAKVVPGSSGGMVVDDSGKLEGIVSATDSYFGYMVPLHIIHDFLNGK